MPTFHHALDEGDNSPSAPVVSPNPTGGSGREFDGGIASLHVSFARRSAAILAMDVVGYSALIELDDLGTASRLRAMRHCVWAPAIAAHSGSLFSVAGDGIMASFSSAADAVVCALAIRAQCHDPKMLPLRTGISYGDVLCIGNELYGSPLNIAARLEARAEPSDILTSGPIFERTQGLCGASFTSLGEWQLEKLRNPCRVYRID